MTQSAPRLRTATAATTLVALLAGCGVDGEQRGQTEPAGTGGPGTSEGTGADAPVSRPNGAPALEWTADGAFDVATLEVPLDYSKPVDYSDPEQTLSIAVVRAEAQDPSRRLGTLVLQPGGPGGSGVDYVKSHYDELPAELKARFDVVGFDPRGVGRSSQLECWDNQEYAAAVDAAKGRPGADALAAALQQAADFAAACRASSDDILPHLGTINVVQDLEQLRIALGEEELTFYGRSYGTEIGILYAGLFPDRVRAMALDGAYDPQMYAEDPYAYATEQYIALDEALGRFFTWCKESPDCTFGGADPEAAFISLLQELDANPVHRSDGRTATGYTLAYRLLFKLNEGREAWPEIARGLQQAQDRDVTADADWILLRPPSPASFNFLTPNVVVSCLDQNYSLDNAKLAEQIARNVEAAPLLGPALAYGPPTYDHQVATTCAQLSEGQAAAKHPGLLSAAATRPLVVVGTTGDPDTPFADARRVAAELGTNATFVTFDAEGHTGFGRSACVTNAVTSVLVDPSLAGGEVHCSDEPAPRGSAGVSRSWARSPAPGGGTVARLRSPHRPAGARAIGVSR